MAYSFFNLGARGMCGQHDLRAALPPEKKPGTHCTGGWMVPRTVQEKCGKSASHWDSIL